MPLSSILFYLSCAAYPLQTQSYILFFASQQFFEEFFCLGMQLFNKTWREMGASTVDVDKVTWNTSRHSSITEYRNFIAVVPFRAEQRAKIPSLPKKRRGKYLVQATFMLSECKVSNYLLPVQYLTL